MFILGNVSVFAYSNGENQCISVIADVVTATITPIIRHLILRQVAVPGLSFCFTLLIAAGIRSVAFVLWRRWRESHESRGRWIRRNWWWVVESVDQCCLIPLDPLLYSNHQRHKLDTILGLKKMIVTNMYSLNLKQNVRTRIFRVLPCQLNLPIPPRTQPNFRHLQDPSEGQGARY
jgi:hypothetical protein